MSIRPREQGNPGVITAPSMARRPVTVAPVSARVIDTPTVMPAPVDDTSVRAVPSTGVCEAARLAAAIVDGAWLMALMKFPIRKP